MLENIECVVCLYTTLLLLANIVAMVGAAVAVCCVGHYFVYAVLKNVQ